jgi:hypothetical protein
MPLKANVCLPLSCYYDGNGQYYCGNDSSDYAWHAWGVWVLIAGIILLALIILLCCWYVSLGHRIHLRLFTVSPAATQVAMPTVTAADADADIHVAALLDIQLCTPHLQVLMVLEVLVQHSSGDLTVSM